jgi:hypothetical protein
MLHLDKKEIPDVPSSVFRTSKNKLNGILNETEHRRIEVV